MTKWFLTCLIAITLVITASEAISSQLKAFHQAVKEANQNLASIKNIVQQNRDDTENAIRKRRKSIEELLANFEENLNMGDEMQSEMTLSKYPCKSSGKCSGNWKNSKLKRKTPLRSDQLTTEIGKVKKKYQDYNIFNNLLGSINPESKSGENSIIATLTPITDSEVNANPNEINTQSDQSAFDDLFPILNMNPTSKPTNLVVEHKIEDAEINQAKALPLPFLSSVDEPFANKKKSNYFYDDDKLISNDQVEITKNDLSHEADYKLSKIEQDAAGRKKLKFKWDNNLVRKRKSFNPMNMIKLKTATRLMSKGMGASLPSNAFKDFMPDYRARRYKVLKTEAEEEAEKKLPITDLDRIEMMLANFDTDREKRAKESQLLKNLLQNVEKEDCNDDLVNKQSRVEEDDFKANVKNEMFSKRFKRTDEDANLLTNEKQNSSENLNSEKLLLRKRRSEDDILFDGEDFDTMERNEDELISRMQRSSAYRRKRDLQTPLDIYARDRYETEKLEELINKNEIEDLNQLPLGERNKISRLNFDNEWNDYDDLFERDVKPTTLSPASNKTNTTESLDIHISEAKPQNIDNSKGQLKSKNDLSLNLFSSLANCSSLAKLQNYLKYVIGDKITTNSPEKADSSLVASPKLAPISKNPLLNSLNFSSDISNSFVKSEPKANKLNVTITATIEGDVQDQNQYIGNGSLSVAPTLKEERLKRGLLGEEVFKAQRDERNCEVHKNFSEKKSKKLPLTEQNAKSSSCKSSDDTMENLLSGKVSANVVKSVFGMVRSNPKLKILWQSLKHNKPQNKQMKNFYAISKQSNQDSVRRSEEMLKKTMETINELIDEQVRSRTCIPLRPDLTDFYETILKTYANQEKSREKREISLRLGNIRNNKSIEPQRIEERSRIVKKLLRQYDNLPLADQNQVKNIRDNLLSDLMFLRKLKDSIDAQQDRHKRDIRQSHQLFLGKKYEADDENVDKKLESQYTTDFLKLWKTSELFRESSSEEDQI